MNNHLSEEQFARCFVEGATGEALHHLLQCPECTAKLDGFRHTISSLRQSLRATVSERWDSVPFISQTQAERLPRLQFAVTIAAVLVLGAAPLLTNRVEWKAMRATQEPVSAEALMEAIDIHLSRTIPSPMEPIISLVPNDEFKSNSGAIQ
jgi:hypothetical protein